MNGPTYAQRARDMRSSDVRDLLCDAQLPGMISMAGGLPAPELFDVEGLRAATLVALDENPLHCLQYGMTEGQPRLREQLTLLLAHRSIPAAIENVIVTTGSQQGLDLIARCLVDRNDLIVVERPAYLAALQVFNLCQPRYFCIASDADGARVEDLAGLPRNEWPKLIYIVSDFANPSGATLSLARRKALLHWAVEHAVFVLEDDPYGQLRTDGDAIPSLMALAQDIPGASNWCGYASTLSKTAAPGLRIGWLVLPPAMAAAVARIKQALDLHSSSFVQEIAAGYLKSGRLSGHIERIRAEYRLRRDALVGALKDSFGGTLSFNVPQGGMFLWARFNDRTDTRRLLARAREEGVIFVPGDAFYANDPDGATLRLNFTGADCGQLRDGAKRLARAHAAIQRGAKRVMG